jgi:predicted nucleotidyltransferase
MFEELLEKLALILEESGIPYMVIGGQAVLVYGEPRLTRDIDITLGVSADQATVVQDIVRNAGLRPLVDPEVFTLKTMVLPCQDPGTGMRVDFIFSFTAYEEQAMKRVTLVDIGQARVRFASLEDLIIHKLVSGRPRDLEDVRSVMLKNKEMDVKYIRKWLRQFAVTLKLPLVAQFNSLIKEKDR